MKRLARGLIGAAIALMFLTAYSSKPVVTEVAADSSKFIEVCSNGVVYLPPGTKFVTCYGRVMRVVAIVSSGEQVQLMGGCNCPRCCDGACAVTVSCGGGDLCVAYLACSV